MTPRDEDATVVVVPADGDFAGLPPDPHDFWYFGTRYEAFLTLTARLPARWRAVAMGDAVNEAAGRLLPILADLDDHLFPEGPPLDWWAGCTAERNPYVDDLYLSLAQAVALVEAARRGGRHVVAVDDPALGRALVDVARRAGLSARWRGPALRRFATLGGFLRAAAGMLRDGWRQRRATWRHGLTPGSLAGGDVWLVTWVGENTFSSGPSVGDTFLGALPAWLRDWGARPGWLANPTGWLSDADAIAAAIARAGEPAAPMAAFVTVAALLGAVRRGLTLMFAAIRPFRALGIDLSPLIRRAIDRDAASGMALRALVYTGIARRCRRLNLQPRVLIYTYENQPWEKQLLAGFRRHCPGTRLVGVQHTAFADRYLSADPSRAQMEAGLFPDLLMTSGEEFRDRLAARGIAPGHLAVGGALRFPELACGGGSTGRTKIATILATLPMHGDEGLELAHKAAIAVADLPGLRLLVNFHPMMGDVARRAIRERIAAVDVGDRVSFVDGPASRWLGETDLLLYNSSGTVFEAARAGLAAIYVGPSCGLDLEKVPGGGCLRCRSAAELAALVARLRNDPAALAAAVADTRAKAARCFRPPDPQAWRHALHLDAGGPDAVRTPDADRGMGERRG